MSEHADETTEGDEPESPFVAPDVDGPSDDEAAEAEEAEANDEPEQETETMAEPPPQARGLSEVEMEKRFKAADRAVGTYARKIADIYGADADSLTECPLCPSIHKGFVDLRDAGFVPDSVKNEVMTYLGYAREREYPQAPTVHACEACDALGKVATGSKVAGKETITCPACQGYGYSPPPTASQNGHAIEVDHTTGEILTPSGGGVPDTDPAGEPRLLPDGRENPNYGKWPQYKVLVEPWGKTAGLTVQDAAV